MREGVCTEGCAACCQFIMLNVNPLYAQNEDTRRWVEYHGIVLKEKNGMTWARIPTPCLKLTPEGRCSVYGTSERPQLCDDWPQSQTAIDELHEGIGEEVCTYRFSQEV